jgi:phenylacetate-CoA ligase
MVRLYEMMPGYIKNMATSVVAIEKSWKKYGEYYKKEFEFLTGSDSDTQLNVAEQRLAGFLHTVAKKVQCYTHVIGSTLDSFPVIDKRFVLENYQKLLLEKPFAIVKSSGTSGRPLPVPYSKNVYQKEYAFWWYFRSFRGVERGEKVATFAGHKIKLPEDNKPPFWVHNFYENQLFFSSYHLSNNNLKYYIQHLNAYKPVFIHGYPSSIYLIARYIAENNIRLSFTPKMIATASETLLDFQRQIINTAFGITPQIWYGNTEYCGHVTECNYGKLHVQPFHSYVRILDKAGKDVKSGEEGFLVGTNFDNHAFSLINYNTFDIVKVSREQTCQCGQKGRILDYILGRIEDYIITPEGRHVGRLDHMFKSAKYVKNGQIEQTDAENLVIRIEKEPGYSEKIENTILHEARDRLGNSINIRFEYVDEIPKDNNGKFKFVIQRLNLREDI